MATDSYYVVGPTQLLEALSKEKDVWEDRVVFDEIEQTEVIQKVKVKEGFHNRGTIRYSLDGKKILLEEALEKFASVMDKIPKITVMTEAEAIQYLKDNKTEWEEPIEEMI